MGGSIYIGLRRVVVDECCCQRVGEQIARLHTGPGRGVLRLNRGTYLYSGRPQTADLQDRMLSKVPRVANQCGKSSADVIWNLFCLVIFTRHLQGLFCAH